MRLYHHRSVALAEPHMADRDGLVLGRPNTAAVGAAVRKSVESARDCFGRNGGWR